MLVPDCTLVHFNDKLSLNLTLGLVFNVSLKVLHDNGWGKGPWALMQLGWDGYILIGSDARHLGMQ